MNKVYLDAGQGVALQGLLVQQHDHSVDEGRNSESGRQVANSRDGLQPYMTLASLLPAHAQDNCHAQLGSCRELLQLYQIWWQTCIRAGWF